MQARPDRQHIEQRFIVQWYAQQKSTSILQHFARQVQESVLESMRRHYTWKRFLIKKMYLYRLDAMVATHKNARMYFQTQCNIEDNEVNALSRQTDTRLFNLMELRILREFQVSQSYFGELMQNYHKQIEQDPTLETIEIASAQQPIMRLLNCVVDLLLHKHTTNAAEGQLRSRESANLDWLHYVRSITEASIQSIAKH